MNYKFIDKSCYLEKEKILIIADLHLGYEQGLQEQGVFIPKTQYKKTIDDLEKIFEEIDRINNKKAINKKEKTQNQKARSLVINKKLKEVIILGDLKHEFSGILQQEWKEVLDLFWFLKEKTNKIIIIKGNHDNYLINVIKKQNQGFANPISLVDYYVKKVGKEKICFLHGDKLFSECLDRDVKKIFLGHLHPAISIVKNVKKEIYKCFLVGKYKDKEIIILPSFFPLVEGADVNIEDTDLAFKLNLKNFNVFVVGDKVYDFGKLSKVGRLV